MCVRVHAGVCVGVCVRVSSVLVVLLLYGIYITNSPSPPTAAQNPQRFEFSQQPLLPNGEGLVKDYCSSDSCRIGFFYCPLVINGCDFSPVTLMCQRN